MKVKFASQIRWGIIFARCNDQPSKAWYPLTLRAYEHECANILAKEIALEK